MNDLPAATGAFHFGECRRVQRRIRAQHDKVAIHPFRNTPAMSRKAEAVGRIDRQGRQDLAKVHAGARHQGEFFGGVELVDVAHVGPEHDLSARLGIGLYFLDGHVDPLLDISGSVLEYRCDVEDGCEAPPRQHFIELLGDCSDESFSAWSNPGVRMCTWLFQNPAVTTKPLQSSTVVPFGSWTVAVGPTAAMRPSWTRTVPPSIAGPAGDG